MIRYENHLGTIDVSDNFFVSLVSNTVVNCFGVAGMARTNQQKGILGWFHSSHHQDKGVRVQIKENAFIIDLHIVVLYGVNISAVVRSIMNKVSYYIEEITGFPVKRVNVFIDGIKNE